MDVNGLKTTKTLKIYPKTINAGNYYDFKNFYMYNLFSYNKKEKTRKMYSNLNMFFSCKRLWTIAPETLTCER